MKKSTEAPSLEEALTNLEKIVQDLEHGQLSLDTSMKKFEEGVKLYKICRQSLESADKKIKILTDALKEEDWSE